MMLKLTGALLIILGCGGVGFAMCYQYRSQERAMEQLLNALEWMMLELNYRLAPLADLCRGAAENSNGVVQKAFQRLAQELDEQLTPDVSACMAATLASLDSVPEKLQQHLHALGTSLGKFDIQGQLSELEAAGMRCKSDLQAMKNGSEVLLRNYQTLGLCAGAALVILFI